MRLPRRRAQRGHRQVHQQRRVLPGASPEEILASQRMSASIEAAKQALRRGPEVHMLATNYGPLGLPEPKTQRPPRPNPPPPLQAAEEPPKGASTTRRSRCDRRRRLALRGLLQADHVHCGACKIAHFARASASSPATARHSPRAPSQAILQIGLTPSGSWTTASTRSRCLPAPPPSRFNGISKAILNAAFDPEYSTRAVATAQVAQSDAFIAAAMGLCGTGGESQGQGEPLVRECMRLALKLSNAQLRYKNKAGKPGGAHAIAVMKPVRFDRLDHTGKRRSVRALLIEIVKFTESGPPDAALLYAKRTPAIPTEVERVALELEHGSTGKNEAPLLKVAMEPNTKEAKQLEVREDVPMLTPGLLNAVFGGVVVRAGRGCGVWARVSAGGEPPWPSAARRELASDLHLERIPAHLFSRRRGSTL